MLPSYSYSLITFSLFEYPKNLRLNKSMQNKTYPEVLELGDVVAELVKFRFERSNTPSVKKQIYFINIKL